ncbi:MAG: class I SAM-dependent methyltransferase, partial [Nitrososphaerales archaeon]
MFADAELARLYDRFHPPEHRYDFAFYLPTIMSARSVLDVGCGTGALLGAASDAGHTGRLCGLDPAVGMLEQARRRPRIDWVRGDLSSVSWEDQFDLVVMTGHAFQVLVTDAELRAALAAIHRSLTRDGRFAFETRNPLAREWEDWTPDRITGVTSDEGAVVLMRHAVETPVEAEIVRFTT